MVGVGATGRGGCPGGRVVTVQRTHSGGDNGVESQRLARRYWWGAVGCICAAKVWSVAVDDCLPTCVNKGPNRSDMDQRGLGC